jgi:hypothetical protein
VFWELPAEKPLGTKPGPLARSTINYIILQDEERKDKKRVLKVLKQQILPAWIHLLNDQPIPSVA